MPRYFFHIVDGVIERDEVGVELPDTSTARARAMRTTGEMLRDLGGRTWDGREWTLEVAGEEGRVLFVVHVSAEERITISEAPSGLPGT